MEDALQGRYSVQKKEQLSKQVRWVLRDYYDALHTHHPNEQLLFQELQLVTYEIIGVQYYAVVSGVQRGVIDKDDFINDCLLRVANLFKNEKCVLQEDSNVMGFIVGVMKHIKDEYLNKYKKRQKDSIPLETTSSEGDEINLLDQSGNTPDEQRLSVMFEGLWEVLSRSIARNPKELEYMKIAILNGLVLKNYSQREVAEIFHISEAAVSQKNKRLLHLLREQMHELQS